MRFTWKALVLAPLVAPFLFSLACVVTLNGKNLLFGFLFFFLLGSVVSYGTTIFLFIPCLFGLSKVTTLSGYKVCSLGVFLAMLNLLPVTWISYVSSGPDSGPPEGTYFAYLAGCWDDTVLWFFPIGGLITAIAYWLLAATRPPRVAEPANG